MASDFLICFESQVELEKNIIFGTLIQFVEMLLGLRIEAISSKFVNGSKSGKTDANHKSYETPAK